MVIQSHLTSSSIGGLHARHLPYLEGALVVLLLFVGVACAQERPALNELNTWFGGQFANKHAFSDTVNGRLYQLEDRYSRLVFVRGPYAVRWVAQVAPMTLVGDPWQRKADSMPTAWVEVLLVRS